MRTKRLLVKGNSATTFKPNMMSANLSFLRLPILVLKWNISISLPCRQPWPQQWSCSSWTRLESSTPRAQLRRCSPPPPLLPTLSPGRAETRPQVLRRQPCGNAASAILGRKSVKGKGGGGEKLKLRMRRKERWRDEVGVEGLRIEKRKKGEGQSV